MLGNNIVERFKRLGYEVGESSQGYYTIFVSNNGWSLSNTLIEHNTLEDLMDFLYRKEKL